GEPQGELIALQVRLARADADDVVLPERARVEAGIRSLLKAHAGTWCARLLSITPAIFTFRRGLVEHAAELNFASAEALLDHAPLLRAARVKPAAFHSLIMNEASSRFEELRFEDLSIDIQQLMRLEERLEGGRLRSLDFEAPFLDDRPPHRLATWPVAVEHFGVSQKAHKGVQLGATFLSRFASAPKRDRLRSLRFERLDFGRVDQPATLFALESLALIDCQLSRQFGNLAKIVTAMPGLRSLEVQKDRITLDELAEVVAACPEMRRLRLRSLDLESVEVLLPWARTLRRLDLMGNPLGEDGAKRIIETEWPHLMELRLRTTRLKVQTKSALQARFGDVFS
ncbi:MAG: hypothetical protein H0T65_05260, partial [Deltaproteobacteria bacterium]|nr:hypothetical protein [Deltaproteobacteria bacterium]